MYIGLKINNSCIYNQLSIADIWVAKYDFVCSYIVNSGEYVYTNFYLYEIQDIGYMQSRGHLICKYCTYSCRKKVLIISNLRLV